MFNRELPRPDTGDSLITWTGCFGWTRDVTVFLYTPSTVLHVGISSWKIARVRYTERRRETMHRPHSWSFLVYRLTDIGLSIILSPYRSRRNSPYRDLKNVFSLIVTPVQVLRRIFPRSIPLLFVPSDIPSFHRSSLSIHPSSPYRSL